MKLNIDFRRFRALFKENLKELKDVYGIKDKAVFDLAEEEDIFSLDVFGKSYVVGKAGYIADGGGLHENDIVETVHQIKLDVDYIQSQIKG